MQTKTEILKLLSIDKPLVVSVSNENLIYFLGNKNLNSIMKEP
jgi:hypothetical protein